MSRAAEVRSGLARRACRSCLAAFLVAAAGLFGNGAAAQEAGEFQLFVENDAWANTDRYYTNGIKLGLGGRIKLLREQAEGLLHWLSPMEGRPGGGDMKFGLFAGQNLYTPKSIRIAAPQPDDRPWAAWLYLGAVAQRVVDRRMDTVEIDVGMVGPGAGGRQVQTEWHKLVDAPRPMGWANQLPNEVGVLASYLQKRRFGSDTFDVVPHAGVTVGNVMTLARLGGIARFGSGMGGFGPDSIEPGGAMLQNWRRREGAGDEAFVFVGLDHRLVARNIFLDGTMFRDSPSVDRHPHVYDLSAGASLRWRELRLSWTRIWRSEEFHTAAGGGGRQRFDSINLGIEFR